MIKVPQQRYIYKINSGRLRKANWDLKINIAEAISNEELISVSESTLIRFIDNIKGVITDGIYEKTKNIENQIRDIKRLPTSIMNCNMIKDLYARKYKLLFMKDYINVVMDSNKDFDRLNMKRGFRVNGIKFKRLMGTPNGIKNYTIIYVNEKMYDKLMEKLNNGRNMDKKLVPSKLESYMALTCSSSIPMSNPEGILVVDDCITKFKSNIIKIDDTKSEYPVITYEKDYEIKLEESDGYGLISPELSERWRQELNTEEHYIPSGFCIRNAFCKGMVFTFDFHEFAQDVAGNHIVKDIWGYERDIRKVDLILTASMLKLWDSYYNLEHYLTCCKKNGYKFSINQYTPRSLEKERNLNYQFIQSLHLNDDDIDELVDPTVQEIKDILGMDHRKSILFLKGIYLDKMDFEKERNDFIKALMIDKRMINDPFVRNKIRNMIKKRIDDAKIGVIKVSGNFSVASGDPFSLCQSIFGMEITGLLKAGEFYSKYWNDKNVKRVACFRAPMSCHNNIRMLDMKNDDDLRYWYRYMNTVTIFNSWDTTAFALNGMDKDGDEVFTSDNEVLLRSIRKTDAILCVQKDAPKVICKERDFIKANKNGFGDEIGTTTNHITAMYDVLINFEEGSPEYNTVMERIMSGQNYQQNAIDKIKGIVYKKMPKEWYKYKDADDKRLVANKKPYFFIYIYPHRKRNYLRFTGRANLNCLMQFGITVDELIILANKTEKQERFMEYYYARLPVSVSNSIMNRICWKVERELRGYRVADVEQFDKSILKSDKHYDCDRYKVIDRLYQSYIKVIQKHWLSSGVKRNDPDSGMYREVFIDNFKSQAYKLCSDAEELCNIVVDICYKSNVSKQFAWDICGDVMVKNLLKKMILLFVILYRILMEILSSVAINLK